MGLEILVNGFKFKGLYENDEKNGHGILYNNENQEIFIGNFLNGRRNGFGKEIDPNN